MSIVCTTAGCISEDEPQGPSISVGEPLPQFSVEMNDGTVISTESLRGKVAVIVFFNTDCSDCRKELPVIQQLWNEVKDNPSVQVVPISREESATDILTYWEANSLTLPFSAQETREIYSLFAPSVIPRTYVSNPDGFITYAYDDSDMPSLKDLLSAIDSSK